MVTKLSFLILIVGLRFDKAIITGHTVVRDDLKGDIPSVLKIIPPLEIEIKLLILPRKR